MTDRKERAAEIAASAKHKVDSKLGHLWWAILIRGLLAVALAICAFVWPGKTLGLLVKILGAYFLVDGVIGVIGTIRSKDKSSPLVQTIVSLAIGLILLLWTGVSGKIFLILVGIWLALQGLSLVWSAIKMSAEFEERNLTMAIGGVLAMIGLGFVLWTNTGVVAISWLIGMGALIIGALLIYLATRVRRIQTKFDNSGRPGSTRS